MLLIRVFGHDEGVEEGRLTGARSTNNQTIESFALGRYAEDVAGPELDRVDDIGQLSTETNVD